MSSGDTDTWGLIDNLGSERYVLDSTGAVIDKLVYDAFGAVAYESAPTVDHFAGFAGGQFDQYSGLVMFYHRPYYPGDGLWLTMDPYGFAAGDTNLTRYAGNEATTVTDATGLFPDDGEPSGPTFPPFVTAPATGEDTWPTPVTPWPTIPMVWPSPGGSSIPAGSPFATGGVLPPLIGPLPSGPFTTGGAFNGGPPYNNIPTSANYHLGSISLPANPLFGAWLTGPTMISYSYGTMEIDPWQFANWLNQVNTGNGQINLAWPQQPPMSIFDPGFLPNWPFSLGLNPHGHISPQFPFTIPGMPHVHGTLQPHFGPVGPTPQHPHPGFQWGAGGNLGW